MRHGMCESAAALGCQTLSASDLIVGCVYPLPIFTSGALRITYLNVFGYGVGFPCQVWDDQ